MNTAGNPDRMEEPETAAGTPLPPGAIVLLPDQGRAYDMGKMRAVFKADGVETRDRYCVSEWWMEPASPGPGPHSHEENEEIFYVLEGTASILVGSSWVEAEKGSFIRIPAGVIHDFANRSDSKMGLLNIFIPGGFEHNMPAIVEWFRQHPQG